MFEPVKYDVSIVSNAPGYDTVVTEDGDQVVLPRRTFQAAQRTAACLPPDVCESARVPMSVFYKKGT